MKNKILSFMFIIGIFLVSGNVVNGVVANPEVFDIQQPSGEKFKAKVNGDEQFNYYSTFDGKIIEKGEGDYWYYIQNNKKRNSEKKWEISNSKVGITKAPSDVIDEKTIGTIDYPKNDIKQSENLTQQNKYNRNVQSLSNNQNVLAILVEFEDVKLKYSEKDWNNIIFNKDSNSLNNYYAEMTQGKINILPVAETHGNKNDGIVKVKLNKKHPNTGRIINDENIKITREALIAANPYIDFNQYDKNGNGKIEPDELHVMVIVSGQESAYRQSSESSIWAHKWSLSSYSVKLDNKELNSYTQFGEQHASHQATLGVIAHEFGHDLGLQDLYNTGWTNDNGTIDKKGLGLGYTSLMASGSWGRKPNEHDGATPVGLDAYSKELLGMKTDVVTESILNKQIKSIDSKDPTILRLNSPVPDEYFLIENRQIVGYDQGVLGNGNINSGGIAIYRVNKKYFKNFTSGKQLVTVLEADESSRGYSYYGSDLYFSGGKADPFYYIGTNMHKKSQQTNLSSQTKPSNIVSNGESMVFDIEVLSKSSNNMLINIKKNVESGKFGTASWEWNEKTQTVTFGPGVFPDTSNSKRIKNMIEDSSQLKGQKIKNIVFTGRVWANQNSSYLFKDLEKLETIKGIENLDVSQVTRMQEMFANDKSLKTLNLNNWNTSKVTSMDGVFYMTKSLESLEISNWNTSQVKTMEKMFSFTGVETLNLNNWNTGNLENMAYLFSNTPKLKNISVSNWNTSKVKRMTSVFCVSESITDLDLNNWDTSNVEKMDYMFLSTRKLKNLKVSKWDTSKVTTMDSIFRQSGLTSLDISNWNTRRLPSVTYYETFSKDIETLKVGENTVLRGMRIPENTGDNSPYTGAWVNKEKNKLYQTSAEFTNQYSGGIPGVYERKRK